jgi:ribosomal protein L40E
MFNYIGSKCIVCDEEFTNDSDVVVCPECGTPYHRECYNKKGSCINVRLHEENGSWREEYEREKKKLEKSVCKNCGYKNNVDSKFCENCGIDLSLDVVTVKEIRSNSDGGAIRVFGIDLGDRYCGLDPKEEIEGVTVEELADFIGTNTYYYLPLFKRMSETGRKWSLNASCLFFSDYYFANRKMYAFWIFALLFSFIISIPSLLYDLSTIEITKSIVTGIDFESILFKNILTACNLILFTFRIIMCVFGNWFYYRYAIKKIKKIKKKISSPIAQKKQIKAEGGVGFMNMVLNLGLYFALAFFIMMIFILII